MRDLLLLVADDEPIERLFVRKMVQRENAPVSKVLEAATGQEALLAVREHKPDLAFLDVKMPGMDGLQAVEHILDEVPEIKVVMVTAYENFEFVRKAFRSGVWDYLLKPVKVEELIGYIQSTHKNINSAERGQTLFSPTCPQSVRAAAEYVEEHLNDKLTLGVIAGAVFVSSCHLSHLFSRHTGKALMEYVLERRLDKAREMLKSTSLSISEISETLGFASLTHFSSCFNKKIGLAPSSYRKNLLNKQYLKD